MRRIHNFLHAAFLLLLVCCTQQDKSFFEMRGVVLSVQDLETVDWPRLAHENGINTIGTHITPEQVVRFIHSEKGEKFLADCKKYGIQVEHQLHAMGELLPRELFNEDSTMFRMNEAGRRVNDYNLCAHSQKALDKVAEKALYYAKLLPSTNHLYYYWIDDGQPMCYCPECSKYAPSEQALIIENRIIKELRKSDPEAKLAHLAYLNTMSAPRRVKPEDGIFLQFAPIHRTWDKPVDEAHLQELKENLTVFPAETAEVLEYWLDVSRFSLWKKPAIKLPWNREVFESDIDIYGRLGIRNITSFAVYIDDQYIDTYKDIGFLKEYGDGLKNYKKRENSRNAEIRLELVQPVVPALTRKEYNPVLKLQLIRASDQPFTLEQVTLSLEGTTQLEQIESITLFPAGKKGNFKTEQPFGEILPAAKELVFNSKYPVDTDTLVLWVSMKLKPSIDLTGRIHVTCTDVRTNNGKVAMPQIAPGNGLRIGVAVRQHNEDGVDTYRIPGLATTRKGTLIALYDVRRDMSRDLQGDIDIGINRSFDGGNTWEPLQIAMDKGAYGGLHEKFNGISDACILVDQQSDDIYIAAIWMYGVLDDNGKWIEGLTESSEAWNHQWRAKGSQSGFGLKETSQFLLTKSTDDGATWGELVNLTTMCKKEEWWLWAPAPGNGITLTDGTLVFPTQGRDKDGKSFSNITWSKDSGKTWTTSPAAIETPLGTTESAVAQLSDGSLMLNMRDNRNRTDNTPSNGRSIAITTDLGLTWTEHPTSRGALIEPTCMASLYKHTYTENGISKSILLFSNPAAKDGRHNITLQASLDDGVTWPESNRILLDEGYGRGYSCLTAIDELHIGILYEGSQADMIFQKIPLKELINAKK